MSCTDRLLPLAVCLLIPGRVGDHAQSVGARFPALLAALHHALIEYVLVLLVTHDLLEQAVAHGHVLPLLLLLARLLYHVEGDLGDLVIEQAALLSLIAALDVIFQELVLKLRHQGVRDLEIHEAVAVIRLETIGHLQEEGGLLQLLGLNLEDFLDEVILRLIFHLLLDGLSRHLICLILKRRGFRSLIIGGTQIWH